MTEHPGGSKLEYLLEFQLERRSTREPIPFLANHRLRIGDVISLAIRPDGEFRPDETHEWRVAQIRRPAGLNVATLTLSPCEP
jgi:hypothetical protein